MTVEEIMRRIVRAHLITLVVCVAIPTALTAWITAREPVEWSASVRVQVLPDAPVSATEAEGRSSRVLALATTPSLVAEALTEAGSSDDPAEVARERVSAERLGESSVVELHVSDRRRAVARKMAAALAQRIVAFMNDGQAERYRRIVADLDTRIVQTGRTRDAVASEAARARNLVSREDLRLKLTALGQQLDQLNQQRTALVLSGLQRDEALVIDGESPSIDRVPSTVLPRSALAALFGLVLGITIAVAVETLRPRVAGIRALARRLGAPVLGRTSDRTADVAGTLRLAARRQGVDTVVLMGVDDRDTRASHELLDDLNHMLEQIPEPALVESASGTRPRGRGKAVNGAEPAEGLDFGSLGFTDLSSVPKSAECSAGVVVVTSGNVLERRLDQLDDVLKATRWPLVGLVEVTGRRRLWRSE